MRHPKGQDRAPLFEALVAHVGRRARRFHVPGHKGGRGAYRALGGALWSEYRDFDLTELGDLDDLHQPRPGGPVDEAQRLAAEAYGADRCRFLAGGATAGVLAMVLAATTPGSVLAATIPFHRSVASAAILGGCRLRPIPPRVVGHSGLPAPAEAADVSRSLEELGAAALLVTSPTYHGLVADLSGLAMVCRRLGLPLLVDAAHGAHFGFCSSLPEGPLPLGAAASVVSLHKTAGALTPGALLLQRQGGLQDTLVDSALRLTQTSSPPFPVLASIDLARRDLVVSGERDWDTTVSLAQETTERVKAGARGWLAPLGPNVAKDPTRLVFELTPEAPAGVTGLDLARKMSRRGVDVEMAGWGEIVAVTTPGDSAASHRQFVRSLLNALFDSESVPSTMPPVKRELALALEKDSLEAPRMFACSPAEAFRSRREAVPLERSVGRIAVETICPYPPGVPLVLPGERLTAQMVPYLEFLARRGVPTYGFVPSPAYGAGRPADRASETFIHVVAS